jgi:hypothetical protein
VLHKAASVAARVDHKDKGEGGAAASRGQDATGWGEAMLPEVCGGATRGRRDCCNDGGRYCCTSNILHRAPTMEVRRRSSWRGCAGRGCCIGNSLDGVLRRGPRQDSPAMAKHTRRGSPATFPAGFSGDGETLSTGFSGDDRGSRGSNRNTSLRKQQCAGSVSLFFEVYF